MNKELKLVPLTPEYFKGVIALGNEVHGDAYLTDSIIEKIYQKSLKDNINCSFVMLDVASSPEKVVGFRLT